MEDILRLKDLLRKLTAGHLIIHQMVLRAFHFSPNSAFSRFSELIPRLQMRITKQCHFFCHKSYFFSSCTRDTILKILQEAKKWIFNLTSYCGVKKIRFDERISNMVSKMGLDNIWPIFWLKNYQNRPELQFQRFLGRFRKNRGQMLFELNSEAIFGILSSRQTF